MSAKTRLEQILSGIAGRPVEITIRGERAFTWWMDAADPEAAAKLAAFAKADPRVTVESTMDPETGTCVYVDVAVA